MNGDIRYAAPRRRGARATAMSVTGLVLSLGLLTGCGSGDAANEGGSDGNGNGNGAASGGGKAAAGPAYKGPQLPGLARQAAWSLPATDGGGTPGVLDLGDTLLFAKDADGAYLSDNEAQGEPENAKNRVLFFADEPESLVLEFRDAKTGALRKSLKVKTDMVSATTWHDGVPAVAVSTSATAESDGLTEESTTSTATLYDATGKKLGVSELPQDDEQSTDERTYAAAYLFEGYRVAVADNTLTLTPIDGGTARTVGCTGSQADCSFLPKEGLATGQSTYAPLIAGTYYAGFENATGYEYDPEQVTLSDLTTGAKVWSSGDVTPPPGVKFRDDGDRMSEATRVLRVEDGRILTAWQTQAGSDTWIDAWYDLKGAKTATASYPSVEEPLLSPSGDLVAATTDSGTVVRQTADGKQLWAQDAGEKALAPVRFSADGSVLYGTTDGTDNGIDDDNHTVVAVDAHTKKVLAKDLTTDQIPYFNDTTQYGYLSTDDGFFVFAPAS
ncbi:hypothetical protein [Streptomyces sp. NBC_00203]|uniref:hypothetical protein n=1 Tax=Streptomyces sp. NBC_00203 TaxID=2975680 RepID=UPI003248258E